MNTCRNCKNIIAGIRVIDSEGLAHEYEGANKSDIERDGVLYIGKASDNTSGDVKKVCAVFNRGEWSRLEKFERPA